jgi:hypothetical protein
MKVGGHKEKGNVRTKVIAISLLNVYLQTPQDQFLSN